MAVTTAKSVSNKNKTPRSPTAALLTDPVKVAKPFVLLAGLVPALRMAWAIAFDPGSLGANPAEAIEHAMGDWCLQFLLLTLAVTPLRRLSGWNWLIKFRRMLGLFAFL